MLFKLKQTNIGKQGRSGEGFYVTSNVSLIVVFLRASAIMKGNIIVRMNILEKNSSL